MKSRWKKAREVSKAFPCPICGADHWCMYDAQGRFRCNHLSGPKEGFKVIEQEEKYTVYRCVDGSVTVPKVLPRKPKRVYVSRRLVEQAISKWTRGRRDKVFEYRDSQNRVSFCVMRLIVNGGKAIRPYYRSPEGWVQGYPPQRPLPLYNLPSLQGTDQVFLVEGEKCADAAREMGVIATTSAQGARSAKHTDFGPLAAKDVFITPDNDEDGEFYAKDATSRLQALSPPATVHILRLPGLGPGEDIADWKERGGTKTRLLKVARAAAPLPAAPFKFKMLSADEVQHLPNPPQQVEGVLTQGALAAIIAPPAVGKTTLGLDLGLSIQAGSPWHGRTTKQGQVVYVLTEGRGGVANRVRAWRQAHPDADVAGAQFILDAPQLHQEEDRAELMRSVAALPAPPAIVFIDTLARSFRGGDENSAQEMGGYIAGAEQLIKRFGCTVVLVHHTAKQNERQERGSSAFRGAVDCMIGLTRDTGSDTIKVSCLKSKDLPEFEPMGFRLVPVDLGDGQSACYIEPAHCSLAESLRATAQQALDALEAVQGTQGATHQQWFDASKLTKNTFDRQRILLLKKNRVIRVGTARPRYLIAAPSKEPLTSPERG